MSSEEQTRAFDFRKKKLRRVYDWKVRTVRLTFFSMDGQHDMSLTDFF